MALGLRCTGQERHSMTRTNGALLVAIAGTAIAYLLWNRQSQAGAFDPRGTVIFDNTPTAGGGD
jgi:hypothetical protein